MPDLTNEDLDRFRILIKKMESLDSITATEIPDISLYMDQVTTFMEDHLKNTRRNEDDKILTKTMINNYAKNKLLPPPEKKRYSKDHMILLMFIYYLKNFMCIQDIKTLLDPLTENYFDGKGEISMSEIYDALHQYLKMEQKNFSDAVISYYQDSKTLFENRNLTKEKKDELQKFAFIQSLAFDIYLKKVMIETLLDEEKNK